MSETLIPVLNSKSSNITYDSYSYTKSRGTTTSASISFAAGKYILFLASYTHTYFVPSSITITGNTNTVTYKTLMNGIGQKETETSDGVTSYAYELNISAPTTVTIVATQTGSAILALYKYVFKIS